MSDQTSFLSPTKNYCFLNSPRLSNGFLSKNSSHAETTSPTSVLDSSNPFVCGCDRTLSKPRTVITSQTEPIGLALIDSIINEKLDRNDRKFSKPINRMALLGSNLKLHIPQLNGSPESESPKSPVDFGTKTRIRSWQVVSPGKDLRRQLSLKEMEMSEDYTCVIAHGPNPKTTHIYDDCILEGCG